MDQNPDWGVQENLALLIHSEISEVLGSGTHKHTDRLLKRTNIFRHDHADMRAGHQIICPGIEFLEGDIRICMDQAHGIMREFVRQPLFDIHVVDRAK